MNRAVSKSSFRRSLHPAPSQSQRQVVGVRQRGICRAAIRVSWRPQRHVYGAHGSARGGAPPSGRKFASRSSRATHAPTRTRADAGNDVFEATGQRTGLRIATQFQYIRASAGVFRFLAQTHCKVLAVELVRQRRPRHSTSSQRMVDVWSESTFGYALAPLLTRISEAVPEHERLLLRSVEGIDRPQWSERRPELSSVQHPRAQSAGNRCQRILEFARVLPSSTRR